MLLLSDNDIFIKLGLLGLLPDFINVLELNKIIIPKFLYKGYQLSVDNDIIPLEDENGLLKANIKNSLRKSQILLEYRGTTLQIISLYISILGVLFVLFVFIQNKHIY